MSELDRSVRLVRAWVRRYTAGLDVQHAALRSAEVDSDLAEHERFRRDCGWPQARIGRERIRRTIVGIPDDLGWRREQLRTRSWHGVTTVVVPVTSAASLLLAAYHIAFAAFLLGNDSLADQQFWGRSPLHGFEGYADEAGAPSAALIIGGLGILVAIAALARPISPVVANAIAMPIALIAVMFFWLGVWLLGLIVLAGAATDLATRAPRPTPP